VDHDGGGIEVVLTPGVRGDRARRLRHRERFLDDRRGARQHGFAFAGAETQVERDGDGAAAQAGVQRDGEVWTRRKRDRDAIAAADAALGQRFVGADRGELKLLVGEAAIGSFARRWGWVLAARASQGSTSTATG
jgi:hypothetical protein